MAKRSNPWLIHLKQFWSKNKGKMSYKAAMKAARATYKKKKKKMRRLKTLRVEPSRRLPAA